VSTASPSQGGSSRRRAIRHRGSGGDHAETNEERWLLTYSDMITLLLVLFIVLFALSRIDQAKFREFKQSVSHAVASRTPKGPAKVQKTHVAAKSTPVNRLQEIKQQLSAALNAKALLGDVTLTINSSGLVEGLVADDTFFSTNSADLSAVGQEIVDTSAAVLRSYPNAIEVAGYTDNEPITGGPYANNWDLSAARATTVVVRMTGTDSVNSGQVVLLGYGQYHPLVPNTSPAAQAQNRRVNIVISPTSKFVQ
jgi:chemotaxis protein MotB